MKILVLDDDEDFLASVRERLADNGLEIIPVATSAEALRILKSNEPSLCLLDIRLEGETLTGVDVFESGKEFRRVPTVFVSGHSDFALDYLLRRGAVELMDKSHFDEEIEDVLARAAQPSILLVDDDSDFADQARDECSDRGLRCVTVTSNESLPRYISECDFRAFDLVVLDVLLHEASVLKAWDLVPLSALPRDRTLLISGRDPAEIQSYLQDELRDSAWRTGLARLMEITEDNIFDKSDWKWFGRIEELLVQ